MNTKTQIPGGICVRHYAGVFCFFLLSAQAHGRYASAYIAAITATLGDLAKDTGRTVKREAERTKNQAMETAEELVHPWVD